MGKNLVDRIEEFGENLSQTFPEELVYKTLVWYGLRNLKELDLVELITEKKAVTVIWKNEERR